MIALLRARLLVVVIGCPSLLEGQVVAGGPALVIVVGVVDGRSAPSRSARPRAPVRPAVGSGHGGLGEGPGGVVDGVVGGVVGGDRGSAG
ncbi:hypothetical protein MOPEL_083_00550 [Mobilicoccus pelagius NBRC 104925]|uniref:Uncharacterized protein n=1 Tax=Mobilicoccus pelagius NBRC 104925 TaxID=1089455 RepID=H5USZ2_9MICO|nr:hypothetical protein MOPEL_083_00550 [Mobilicoccus pelagius NBRC 104925]